jgi:hypothetical protein
MKQLIEVTALRIGAVIQDICANVDFEVLSLPGGSLIATLLSICSIAMSSSRRAAVRNRGFTITTGTSRCAFASACLAKTASHGPRL